MVREGFPDLNFWGTADLIAEGDFVVGQWEGGGTDIGLPSTTSYRSAFRRPPAYMRFTCTPPSG